MKSPLTPQEWSAEFEGFLKANEATPPKAVAEIVLNRVASDLNPPAWNIFAKLSLIHLIVGGATLLACPQFGISILPGMGLMAIFMKFGHTACMAACGAFFLGGSFLLAALALRPEEVRKLRQAELIYVVSLAAVSAAVLICVGGTMILQLGLAWLAGSLLGGILTLELGWRVRTWAVTKRPAPA